MLIELTGSFFFPFLILVLNFIRMVTFCNYYTLFLNSFLSWKTKTKKIKHKMNIWFFYICRSFDDKELEIASSKMVKKITIPWWFQNILCPRNEYAFHQVVESSIVHTFMLFSKFLCFYRLLCFYIAQLGSFKISNTQLTFTCSKSTIETLQKV